MTYTLQDARPFAGHSPEQERPLGGYAVLMSGYAVLMSVYTGLCAAFAGWFARSGRELPDRVAAGDLALGAVATHKASRLVTRDRVTSAVRAPFTRFQDDAGLGEVDEEARGSGLRRAIGELLICPYCLDMWVATAFLAGLLVFPRATRWIASVLASLTGSDTLQIAYRKTQSTL